MSEAVRTAISTAVSTVDGVACSPYFRSTTKAGDAMVRKDRIAYPNPFGGVVTWQVLVMLPTDLTAAEKFLDEKIPQIVAALAPELVVSEVRPEQLAVESRLIPVALIQGTREEEN